MSEVLFCGIQIRSLDEDRREAGLKSYTDIVTLDDLEGIDKISRIEPDLVISLDFCGDFCLTRTKLCISRVESDNTATIESHFDIKIIFSSDETHLPERLYEFWSIGEGVDACCFWEEIGVVWEVTIEETRVEENTFVHEQDLIVCEIDLNIDAIRESLHHLAGTSRREDNGDFLVYTRVTIVSIFREAEAVRWGKSDMISMELDIDTSESRTDISAGTGEECLAKSSFQNIWAHAKFRISPSCWNHREFVCSESLESRFLFICCEIECVPSVSFYLETSRIQEIQIRREKTKRNSDIARFFYLDIMFNRILDSHLEIIRHDRELLISRTEEDIFEYWRCRAIYDSMSDRFYGGEERIGVEFYVHWREEQKGKREDEGYFLLFWIIEKSILLISSNTSSISLDSLSLI